MQSAHTDAAPPRRLGRYELLFRIAAGGMAEVFAARVSGEAGFQKLVAVKRMLPTLADDEEFVTMFLDEARVAAHIASPHVVATHDLGRADDGSLYIAMELVVGVTISRILRSHARKNAWVPLPMAVELLGQASQGLQDAHEATTPVGAPLQIVHRDVSPQNILVGVDGRVRLTDFGVARAVLRMTHTVGGRVKGKFAYASPEQLAGNDVDRRSDVFSLGIVAWELFSGQRLFLGEHPVETIERVRSMPIPAVHHVRSDVPIPISNVIAAALDRDIERRVPTARDFGVMLREAAHASGIGGVERDDLRRFVADAGGEDLDKIQGNIKKAMENRAALDTGPHVPVEPDRTPGPSSSSGVIIRTPSSQPTTDKELTSAETAVRVQYPDDSASVRAPGSLITPAPPQPNRSRIAVWTAVAAVLLIGIGSAVGWWITRRDDGVARQLADEVPRAAAAPAPAEPVTEPPPSEQAEVEPAPTVGTLDEDEAEVETDEVGDERTTRRSRRTNAAARRRARGSASVSAPSEPAASETASAPAPVEARAAAEPERRQRVQPAPEPTMQQGQTQMRSGFVGLDAFERDLERRR